MSKRSKRRTFESNGHLIPYCRQSRARIGEQADTSLSLDSQEAMIREWGQRNGYTVEQAIRDHEEDSESIARTGLASLYAAVRPGVTVAVELWDRLGRGWSLSAINAEVERRGGRTVSVTQGSDSLSRELHGLMGGQYLIQLSDRLHSVARTRVERGQHVGAIPYGYDRPFRVSYTDKNNVQKVRHSGPLHPIEPEASTVRLIFSRIDAGDSLRTIAIMLASQGITSPRGDVWNPETVAWIARNPVYAGGVRMGERINWSGVHEAIITHAQWETAQLRMARTPIVRVKDASHWAEGLIVHSCNARMLLNMVSRPGGGRYPSYRCTNSARVGSTKCSEPRQHIGAPLLDRAVRERLAEDIAQIMTIDDVVETMRREAGGDETGRERQRLALQRDELERRRSRARDLWIAGMDDLETFQRTHKEISSQIATIESAIADLPSPPDPAVVEAAHRSVSLITDIDLLEPETLRTIITELGVIVVSEDGVSIRYWPRYRALFARMRSGG